jgi:hypothetical protein
MTHAPKPKLIRVAAALLLALFLTSEGLAAQAASWVFKITKTGIGIKFRNSPNWSDSAGPGGYDGDTFTGECWNWGTAQGSYANRIWWVGTTKLGRGWIPDAYLTSPNRANEPIPGAPQCGSSTPPPPGGLTFTVTGSCTSTSGTLSNSSTGFTAGGRIQIAAWYPNGNPYTNLVASATARTDGSVPWSWPCNGDPSGTYRTTVTDLSTSRAITGNFVIGAGTVVSPPFSYRGIGGAFDPGDILFYAGKGTDPTKNGAPEAASFSSHVLWENDYQGGGPNEGTRGSFSVVGGYSLGRLGIAYYLAKQQDLSRLKHIVMFDPGNSSDFGVNDSDVWPRIEKFLSKYPDARFLIVAANRTQETWPDFENRYLYNIKNSPVRKQVRVCDVSADHPYVKDNYLVWLRAPGTICPTSWSFDAPKR